MGLLALVAVVAVVIGGAFLLSGGDDDTASPPSAAAGLPDTPDYHSLLVSPNDADRLVLGTHAGLYESSDGGRAWEQTGLVDRDAMNLARTPGATVWAAGHGVLAKSTDGGESWTDVSPAGLPHLDVHGFAAHPRNSARLYAAIAGEGLYRSTDGGGSFALVSEEVGPDVFGLAVTPEGRLLAADSRRGLFVSDDDGGSWRQTLPQPLLGVAVNPARPRTVVAAGPGGVFVSNSGGASWDLALVVAEGGGPLAWAPSRPNVAYAVGFDKRLYRSNDWGATWQPVTET